ncbi:MAG: sugar ABC transporter permease [Actinobacteria bacterium]|nr:sugar ABC transporter permease [Actinomycetota bacterium]
MKKSIIKPFFYIIPSFIFLIIFIYYGAGYNFYTGFFKWNGVSRINKEFIGFANYIKLFSDENFIRSLFNTVIVAIGTIIFAMFIGYIIAIMLNYVPGRLQYIYKVIFFIPHVLSQVVIAYNLRLGILDFNSGYLNRFLKLIGLNFLAFDWMGNIRVVIYTVTFSYVFMMVGFCMVIYYTSMLTIPNEIIEAARVDGAVFFHIVFKIFFPMLQSTHIMLVIFSIISATRLFDLVWIMTEGGPAGYSEILSTNIFRQSMIYYKQGYASAISNVILIIVLIASFVILSYQTKQRAKRGW